MIHAGIRGRRTMGSIVFWSIRVDGRRWMRLGVIMDLREAVDAP